MKRTNRSIFTSIAIIFLFLLSACINDEFEEQKKKNSITHVPITFAWEAVQEDIYPEVETYYENLTILAQFYASNPELRTNINTSDPKGLSQVMAKWDSMLLYDSLGAKVSVFDLPSPLLKSFFETWKKIEAYEMSRKLSWLNGKESLKLIEIRNKAFADNFPANKSATVNVPDPFWVISQGIQAIETTLENIEITDLPSLEEGSDIEKDFWKTVLKNKKVSSSIIQSGAASLTSQQFVDRIRPNIKKGRVLIALPGGWTTHPAIIFYPDKNIFDVGHVAIISKDSHEIPDSISDEFNFSIGSSLRYITEAEQINRSWCKKHAFAMLTQVFKEEWSMFKSDDSGTWQWARIWTDIDGEQTITEAEKQIGKPYCSVSDVFAARKAAPESFICSSLIWWAVKESTGIELTDWWSPSIYPVDVLLSENIRIIDDTFF
jgi:hypothetical protein